MYLCHSLFTPLSFYFTFTETCIQAGFVELEEISPQAVNYLRNSGVELWASPRSPGKRYGHNTSNIVESLNNWILEERKFSIVDLLHVLWCKTMDLRFRLHQEGEKYDAGTVLTKYTVKLLEKSMSFSNHRRIQFADAMHASVLSFQGKWYVIDLLESACTCGHFQYNDIPCRHAIAVVQEHHDPAGGQCRSVRQFIPYNLTLEAFKAAYA